MGIQNTFSVRNNLLLIPMQILITNINLSITNEYYANSENLICTSNFEKTRYFNIVFKKY